MPGPSKGPKSRKVNGKDAGVLESFQNMVLGEQELSPAQKSERTQHIAIDCEMVGTGPNGSKSVLARVSVVNEHGAILLDTFVRQAEVVTDYRTRFSGVRREDVEGPDALPFKDAKAQVLKIIRDRVLVGHSIHHDVTALKIWHEPKEDVQRLPIWKRKYPHIKTPGLKMLVRDELGLDIQKGEHSSVVDARATMALFLLHRDDKDKGQPSQQAQHSRGRGSASMGRWKGKNAKGAQATSNNSYQSPPPRSYGSYKEDAEEYGLGDYWDTEDLVDAMSHFEMVGYNPYEHGAQGPSDVIEMYDMY